MKRDTLVWIVVAVAAIGVALYMYKEREDDLEEFTRRQNDLEARLAAEEAEPPQTVYVATRPYPVFWGGGRRWRRRRH